MDRKGLFSIGEVSKLFHIYDGETMDMAEILCVRLCFRGSHATLIDYGITNDPEKFVTQICIPVKCD